MNSMNDRKWLLVVDSPYEFDSEYNDVLNCQYPLKFIRCCIDDIRSVQFCRRIGFEKVVLNLFQTTSSDWIMNVCTVNSGMLTVTKICDFNVYSLSEFFVKLDLGGYFYDEPSIVP